jgi:hypothetical protein
MNGYVAAGYGITMATLAGYALRVVLRGRAVSRALRLQVLPGGALTPPTAVRERP